jgi:hypothetical protein
MPARMAGVLVAVKWFEIIINSIKLNKKSFRYIPNRTEKIRSQGSVVSIATGSRLNDQGVGVRVPVSSRIFSSPNRPERL